MILTPTTFIVGAGASAPYGLPLGAELRRRAEGLKPSNPAFQLLINQGHQPELLNRWLDDLRHHPTTSIDAFLELRQTRPEFVSMGRSVIAALMGQAIRKPGHAPPGSGDWLRRVIDTMRSGAYSFEQFVKGNKGIRFVTFNFDSVIEQRLCRDVSRLYEVDPHRVNDWLEAEGVVTHVHGRLPPPPESDIVVNPQMGNVTPAWAEWLEAAAQTVHVTLDPIHDNELAYARESVRWARVVCFLGFAFEQTNLERLELKKTFSSSDAPVEVYGSAFGIDDGYRFQIRRRLNGLPKLGEVDADAAKVLGAFPIFRD